MTLLETMVALVIAAGVIVGALETSRMANSRTAIALLESEAAILAEGLLSKVGAHVPLEPGHHEGSEHNGVSWSLDINAYLPRAKGIRAFEITAAVSIKRGGLSVRQEVATIKLAREISR
jgi:hypothetical protein